MRLDREHDEVRAAGVGDAVGRVDARDDLFAALLQHEAALPDGLQVLSARNDAHGFARRGELGRHEAADRPRPNYGDVHRSFQIRRAACPECIAPDLMADRARGPSRADEKRPFREGGVVRLADWRLPLARRLSPNIDNDIADDLAALDDFVSFGDIVQRDAPGDRVNEPAALKQIAKLGNRRAPLALRDVVDEEETQRDRVLHQPKHGKRAHVHRRAVDDDARVRPQDGGIKVGVAAEIHLDQNVDPAPACQSLDALRYVFRAVVDDLVGAGASRMRGLRVAADRRDDARSAQLGEPDGIVGDGAGAADDEDRRSRLNPRRTDGMHRGERWNAKASALGIARTVWQMNGLYARQDNIFRGSAIRALPLPVPDPDALAGASWRARTDRVDLARAVAVRDDERSDEAAAITAPPHLPVRRIDPGRPQLDPHLPWPRLRGWLIADFEHVARWSLLRIKCCTHVASPPFVADGRVGPHRRSQKRKSPSVIPPQYGHMRS